jgi:ribonuclease T2
VPVTSSNQRSANDGAYDDRYQSESRHRHHHGREREGSNDGWSSYDRPETADASLAGDASSGADRDHGRTRSRAHHNSRALTASPGQFDFYVLNLSWSPEFCHGHPNAAECAQHRAFTLHGLWPQNNDGTYPEDCSEAPGPTNPSQYADIYPDASLLQHEWQTHGTCSGLGADQFLTLARRADQSIQIPSQLAHMTQTISLAPAQVITLFTQSNPSVPASSLALTCGNNFLTAVEVCMDKNLKPESCSAVKSCGANQIRIPAPQ